MQWNLLALRLFNISSERPSRYGRWASQPDSQRKQLNLSRNSDEKEDEKRKGAGLPAGLSADRHNEKRKNNPPIGMVSYEPKVAEGKTRHYAYDPHLSPQLVWAGRPGIKSIV